MSKTDKMCEFALIAEAELDEEDNLMELPITDSYEVTEDEDDEELDAKYRLLSIPFKKDRDHPVSSNQRLLGFTKSASNYKYIANGSIKLLVPDGVAATRGR